MLEVRPYLRGGGEEEEEEVLGRPPGGGGGGGGAYAAQQQANSSSGGSSRQARHDVHRTEPPPASTTNLNRSWAGPMIQGMIAPSLIAAGPTVPYGRPAEAPVAEVDASSTDTDEEQGFVDREEPARRGSFPMNGPSQRLDGRMDPMGVGLASVSLAGLQGPASGSSSGWGGRVASNGTSRRQSRHSAPESSTAVLSSSRKLIQLASSSRIVDKSSEGDADRVGSESMMAGGGSHWREFCHSAAPPPFSRRFNRDGEGISAK